MARRIVSLLLIVQLCTVFLAVSVSAATPIYDFGQMDSGVQLFAAAPASAAAAASDEGVALAAEAAEVAAAAEQFGWKFEDFNPSFTRSVITTSNGFQFRYLFPGGTFSPGWYSLSASLNTAPDDAFLWYDGARYPGFTLYTSDDGLTQSVVFYVDSTLDLNLVFSLSFNNPVSVDIDTVDYVSSDFKRMVPSNGISSGVTYSSGTLDASDQTHTVSLGSVSFGDQPPGDYLINIYHYLGRCTLDVRALYQGRRLYTHTSPGLTSFLVSHGGGDMSVSLSAVAQRIASYEVIGGYVDGEGSVSGSSYVTGESTVDGYGTVNGNGSVTGSGSVNGGGGGGGSITDGTGYIQSNDSIHGSMSIDGSSWVSGSVLVEGTGYVEGEGSVSGSSWVEGETYVLAPDVWSVSISDVIAVPLAVASAEQFGFFAPVVGFFRDFLPGLFDEFFGFDKDTEFEQQTSEAAGLQNQEQQQVDQILGDFEEAAADVSPSSISIPSDVLSGFTLLSTTFTSVFSSLGSYQALVYIPLSIGIAMLIIGRGFSTAEGRLRRSAAPSRKGGSA